ncbi:MAG: hypothetical protein V1793_05355 [Pseudomonadota bacterium]
MQRLNEPPKIKDFSRNAINRAVLRTAMTHWLTVYPPAIGIPAGIAGLLFNSPLVCALGLAACFVSLGNAVITYFFRNETIANTYIHELNRKLKEQETLVLQSLENNLKHCTAIPGAESLASQGVEQFHKIKVKYQNVQDLLQQKLDAGELTFGRFMGAAEQVYLGALDNLKQAVSTLQSVSSIDLDYINTKLGSLSDRNHRNASDQKEIESLTKRLQLWQEQIRKVNELLSDNEDAMTRMEETTAAIAELKTGETFAATDLETAMGQLQELAQRAKIYNKH